MIPSHVASAAQSMHACDVSSTLPLALFVQEITQSVPSAGSEKLRQPQTFSHAC